MPTLNIALTDEQIVGLRGAAKAAGFIASRGPASGEGNISAYVKALAGGQSSSSSRRPDASGTPLCST